jgi:hypothetical protein
MKLTPTNVSSVGGGDHILMALLNFDSIKVINNIDVSPIGLLASLAKFVTLSSGTYGDWFELLTGSMLEKRLMRLLNSVGIKDTYKLLYNLYNERVPGGNPLASLSYNPYNVELFNGISVFSKLKAKINQIDNFNSILHDVYNIDLMQDGIVKEQSDLFLISNAYYYDKSRTGQDIPSFIKSSLKVGGHVIASVLLDWFNKPDIKATKVSQSITGSWQFYMIERIK